MTTKTKQKRITSAQLLCAHRRALEAIDDLYAVVNEMPIATAADPVTMKSIFDELSDVRETAIKLAASVLLHTNDDEDIFDSF
jgi:hypothetical protein